MVVMVLFILMPIIGCTGNNNRDDRRRGAQGPPAEAIKACEGKELGDTVEFTGRRGESLKATCQNIDDQLVAVPEGMSSGGARPQ